MDYDDQDYVLDKLKRHLQYFSPNNLRPRNEENLFKDSEGNDLQGQALQDKLINLTGPQTHHINFAYWVPENQRPIIEGYHRRHFPRIIRAWLEDTSDEAKQSWTNLYKRYSESPDVKEMLDSLHAEVSCNLTFFIDEIQRVVAISDSLAHQSLQITTSVRHKHITKLEKHLQGAVNELKALKLEHESLLSSPMILPRLKEKYEFYKDVKCEEDLFGFLLFDLDIKITDILQSELNKLQAFKEYTDVNSLTSPNSLHSRRNHFIRNWIHYTVTRYGQPLWDISTYVASVALDDPDIDRSVMFEAAKRNK